jgi:hypothetical protein
MEAYGHDAAATQLLEQRDWWLSRSRVGITGRPTLPVQSFRIGHSLPSGTRFREAARVLSDIDREYLIERLTKWLAPFEKPRETLASPFINTSLPKDLTTGLTEVIVRDAVRLCIADGWNHDPVWLVLLIELVPLHADAKLVEIRDRVRVKPPLGPDRLDATVLDNGIPFVNRTALRRQLRRLAAPSASVKPILVVSGAAKSGKTYSAQYIDHFAVRPSLPTMTYRYALAAGAELETGPEEVAIELVSLTGHKTDGKPASDTNQKRYARNLARWAIGEIVQISTHQHWIVLDNFQGEKLRPDTRDFVIAFAELVTNGVFKEKCRLILIGFDRSHLSVDPGWVDEERIAASKPADIKTCVGEIAARAPVQLTVDLLYDFATNGLPAANGRMPELNTRLRGLLLAVDQITEISRALSLQFDTVLGTILQDLPAGSAMLPEIEKRLDELRESAGEVGP